MMASTRISLDKTTTKYKENRSTFVVLAAYLSLDSSPRSFSPTLVSLSPHVSTCASWKNVLIVDTHNDIGGEGSIPHRGAIGDSRRIMVPPNTMQHRCLPLLFVQNSGPYLSGSFGGQAF